MDLLERFLPVDLDDDREVFRDDLRELFRRGTLPPFSRASLRPIAIACFRLVTFRPELLLSVPFFRRRIADSTRFDAARPYLAIPVDLLRLPGAKPVLTRSLRPLVCSVDHDAPRDGYRCIK